MGNANDTEKDWLWTGKEKDWKIGKWWKISQDECSEEDLQSYNNTLWAFDTFRPFYLCYSNSGYF